MPAPPLPAQNPFEIGLLAQGNHFADREREVARIVQAFRSPGSRLVVYGDRRLGKSSALDRAATVARKAKQNVVVVTLATATDPEDAAQQVVRAVQEQIGRDWRSTLEGVAARLQATLEVRPSAAPGVPPSVRFGFGLREQGEQRNDLLWDALGAVNAQMAAEKQVLGIGIDEFQRIHEWGGEDAEWALKSAMETHRNLSYVLAGSKRHLIEAMVSQKGRALWKQVDILPFTAIDPEIMAEWIHQHAARTGITFSLAACDAIVQLAGPRTRDVVQLARVTWDSATQGSVVDQGAVEAAMEKLVREEGALFATLWRARAAADQRVLRALAAEPRIEPTGAEALQQYRLGPKSTVASVLSRLVDQEVLSRDDAGRYTFDDPFFRRWVQINTLSDLGLPVPPLRQA